MASLAVEDWGEIAKEQVAQVAIRKRQALQLVLRVAQNTPKQVGNVLGQRQVGEADVLDLELVGVEGGEDRGKQSITALLITKTIFPINIQIFQHKIELHR
jgi:hypothetical protein